MIFEEAFEQAVPELVAAAWDFADRSEVVELIWIYLSKGGHWAFYHPYYQIAATPTDTIELAHHIPNLDVGPDAQRWMLDRLEQASNGIIKALDNPDDFPRRIIITYRPHDQDLTADFYYDDLQPGTPEKDRLDELTLFEQWLDRLKTTGNASAQP